MFPTTCHCGKIVMITSTSLIEKVYYQSDLKLKLYPVCPEWQGLAGKWYFKWKILSLWKLLWPLVQTPIDLSQWQFRSDRFFLLSFMLCNSMYFCDLPRKYHGFHELNCICRNIFSVGAEKNMEIVSIIQSLERFFSGHFDVFPRFLRFSDIWPFDFDPWAPAQIWWNHQKVRYEGRTSHMGYHIHIFGQEPKFSAALALP